ncbi:hypothetical protein [Myxococcus sp. CA040A]|uniref:hypothetical protein n=1 Tax=Myxococcus sp. CA040A TaxID=2741738 RepID=UPI00157A9791|nr:hypothetical protein [Myxococcus sp. CA040A]NTX07570.1 hypothetical protein [Myxococcus sp. CA040A]
MPGLRCGKWAALVLHGHGVRERQVLGPVEWGEVPLAPTVGVRRFQCTSCRATHLAP